MDEKKTAASNWVVHTAHSAFWFLGKSAQIHYCDKRLKLWLTLIHTHTHKEHSRDSGDTSRSQQRCTNKFHFNRMWTKATINCTVWWIDEQRRCQHQTTIAPTESLWMLNGIFRRAETENWNERERERASGWVTNIEVPWTSAHMTISHFCNEMRLSSRAISHET